MNADQSWGELRSAVPPPPPLPILEPPRGVVRVPGRGRLVAAGIAGACLLVLLVAASLAPDPAGVGTQGRLGMETCGFLRATGLPCAGCGMTTSFNHAVRWRFDKALWAQPMGLALAAGTVLAFWGSAYVAATGRPVHRLLSRGLAGQGVKVAVGTVAAFLVAWAFKITLTLAGAAGTNW